LIALAVMLSVIGASAIIGFLAAKLKMRALRADTYIVAGRASVLLEHSRGYL
jgi:hypothetical protein